MVAVRSTGLSAAGRTNRLLLELAREYRNPQKIHSCYGAGGQARALFFTGRQTASKVGGPPGNRTPNLRIKSPLLCLIELEAPSFIAGYWKRPWAGWLDARY